MIIGGLLMLGIGIGMLAGDPGAGTLIGLGLGLVAQAIMQHRQKPTIKQPTDDD